MINTNDIPDSTLLKYCIRDYKREKQLREQAQTDLVSLKHSLDVMTTMCEMITEPTQRMIAELVNKKVNDYKISVAKLNELVVKLKAENTNLATINRELMKRIELLEKLNNSES